MHENSSCHFICKMQIYLLREMQEQALHRKLSPLPGLRLQGSPLLSAGAGRRCSVQPEAEMTSPATQGRARQNVRRRAGWRLRIGSTTTNVQSSSVGRRVLVKFMFELTVYCRCGLTSIRSRARAFVPETRCHQLDRG